MLQDLFLEDRVIVAMVPVLPLVALLEVINLLALVQIENVVFPSQFLPGLALDHVVVLKVKNDIVESIIVLNILIV